jgi:uncharacterized protein (DUF2141 family)
MRVYAALLVIAAGPVMAADLAVTITGARPDGAIRLVVADGPAAFAARDGIRHVVVRPVGGQAHMVLSELPPGRFAIAVFQDTDGDGTLDTVLGIPTEPYGFSNDAIGRLGPPDFSTAAFLLDEAGGEVSIGLR